MRLNGLLGGKSRGDALFFGNILSVSKNKATALGEELTGFLHHLHTSCRCRLAKNCCVEYHIIADVDLNGQLTQRPIEFHYIILHATLSHLLILLCHHRSLCALALFASVAEES